MVEKFDSEFHKDYVGGEGEVEDAVFLDLKKEQIVGMTVEEIVKEYRDYVHDPEAELPAALIEELRLQKKIL